MAFEILVVVNDTEHCERAVDDNDGDDGGDDDDDGDDDAEQPDLEVKIEA